MEIFQGSRVSQIIFQLNKLFLILYPCLLGVFNKLCIPALSIVLSFLEFRLVLQVNFGHDEVSFDLVISRHGKVSFLPVAGLSFKSVA